MSRWPYLAVLALPLSACGTKRQDAFAAQKTVAHYLDAERAGRYEEAWSLLAPTDRAAHSVESYIQDHEDAGVIWQEVARRTRFEMAGVHKVDDYWLVEVTASRPDPAAVQKIVRGVSPESIARSADPTALVRQHVRQTLDRQAVPPSDEELRYAVVTTADGPLRVWLGLDRQFTAIEYARRARAAAQRGDEQAQRRALEAILEVPADPSGVVESLAAEARTTLTTLEARADVVRPGAAED